jgi:GNAT superfamily N-acetyltransferase
MVKVEKHTILPLAERPGYLDIVAGWVWEHWHDHSGLTREQTRARLDDPGDCPATLVAEENDAPVGVLGFQRFVRTPGEPPSLFVDVLFVPESERGRGIGAALVREGVERARRFAPDLFVYTSQRDWYLRRGWTMLKVDPVSSLFVLSRSL